MHCQVNFWSSKLEVLISDIKWVLDGTPFQDDKDAETLSSKSTAESVSEDLSDFVNRPIHLAAKSGNLEIIKELARYKANLNAINEQRQTALHISTAHSKFQVTIT